MEPTSTGIYYGHPILQMEEDVVVEIEEERKEEIKEEKKEELSQSDRYRLEIDLLRKKMETDQTLAQIVKINQDQIKDLQDRLDRKDEEMKGMQNCVESVHNTYEPRVNFLEKKDAINTKQIVKLSKRSNGLIAAVTVLSIGFITLSGIASIPILPVSFKAKVICLALKAKVAADALKGIR
jgi:Mg2+ and Co2+ transporter CorA